MKDIEEIKNKNKLEKYSQKNNYLCVHVCVGFLCVLLCVDI